MILSKILFTTCRHVLIFTALFTVLDAHGAFVIKMKVKGMPLYPVLLTDFRGDKNTVIDTAFTDAKGVVIFTLPDNQHPGMYKLVFKDDKYVDFIFNGENVEMETDISKVSGSLVVIKSTENQLYFNYLMTRKQHETKLEALQQLHDKYPGDDPFVLQVKKEYDKQRSNLTRYEDSICKEAQDRYVGRIVRVKKEQTPDIDADGYTQVMNKKQHWFDNIDFNDTLLLYSGVITTKIIDYLTVFASKHYEPEQQVQMFRMAIDTVVEKAKVNKKMYDFAVDFLFDGFEQMGDVNLVEYVASKYMNENSCEHDGKKTTLERKVLTYTRLKTGSDAPAFSLMTDGGLELTLDLYANRTVMLVFWASWCQHCMEALPAIANVLNSRTDRSIDLITVSLDTNKTTWKDNIKKLNLTGATNTCDGKSWEGNTATSYHVYATPTIILIKNKKIIGRPYDLQTMEKILRDNNIIGL